MKKDNHNLSCKDLGSNTQSEIQGCSKGIHSASICGSPKGDKTPADTYNQEEFNLNKEQKVFYGRFEYPFPRVFYFEEDVREFIRRLKDKIRNHQDFMTRKDNPTYEDWIIGNIDELAGKELI